MPKNRRYYTLAIRAEGRWTPQFGAYQRATVEQEARDAYTHDPDGRRIKASDRKIVASEPDNDAINRAIDALNRLDPLLPFAVSALLFPMSRERAL
jgi:hypothetical protein